MASFLEKLNYAKDLCIFECNCTLFIDGARKWVNGKFYISPEGLCFECNEEHRSVAGFFALCIDFNEISILQKESSSYVFPSITCYVLNQKYWFASFANREAVFNMLEHFWRESLFILAKRKSMHKTSGGSSDDAASQSTFGQDLLRIAYDSEKTLNSSAFTLQRQGKQLDSAEMTADDIHGVLKVADQKLSILESWTGRVMSAFNSSAATAQQKTSCSKPYIEYSVVFCKNVAEKSKENIQQGALRIDRENLVVVNTKGVVAHHFKKGNISAIYLISPWEIKIIERRIGQKDVSYSVVTSQLVMAFTFLQRYYESVLEMEEPGPKKQQKYRPNIKASGSRETHLISIADGLDVPSLHVAAQEQTQQQLISDSEANELQRILSGMKSVALEINQEQHEHVQKIDHLISSVDSASIKVKEDTQRIKRLM